MAVTLLSDTEFVELQAELAEAQRRGLTVPPELELAILRHEAMRRGHFPFRNFRDYVGLVNPTLLDYEHVPLLVDEAQKLITGETLHLLVLMPTRHWKSEVFSRLLPSYALRVQPNWHVAVCAYGADLAWDLSREAQEYYRMTQGTVRADAQGKKRWGTGRGGELWAAGVAGPGLGRGFHLGIVDDPIKADEVYSQLRLSRFQRWWSQTFLGRRQPPVKNVRLVFVMQRLGADDPVDYLLRREVGENTDRAPLHWRVLVLDEIHSDEPLGRWNGPQGLPETCTLVGDPRKVGEVIAPSLQSKEEVLKAQQQFGPYVTASQRQQRPMSPTGGFWQKPWFEVYRTLPSTAYDGGKDWDTAYTENERNAASAFIESYRGPGKLTEFPIYIEDVDWQWVEFPALIAWMRSAIGPHYVEAKASGKSSVQTLRAHGIAVKEVQVKGSKFERAVAAQPAVTNHRVFVRQAVIDKLLYGERQGLLRISAEQLIAEGAGLDVNDVFTQAIDRHLGLSKAKRHVRFISR